MQFIASEFEDISFTYDLFEAEIDGLFDFCRRNKNTLCNSVCVAVSGGSDSIALLVLTNNWAKKNGKNIFCVTVDHQLRKESADEAVFVDNFCKSIGVKHKILTWHKEDKNISEGKIENLAREARYNLISSFCKQESIHTLLTGHTWNDQLETFEMRKKFGSSPNGLACMSRVRSISSNLILLRPLLHFYKKHLEAFLKKNNINWKTDPMNFQENFMRVLHRKNISSYNEEKISEISKEIICLGKQRNEMEKPAVEFLKKFCSFSKYGYAIIELSQFLNKGITIQAEILKRVIWNIGGKKYAIHVSENILKCIISRKINTIGRCLLRIKKDRMFVFRENRNIKPTIVKNHGQYIWDNRFLVKVKLNNCTIESCLDYFGLPRDALFGLPCVCQNHKMLYNVDSLDDTIFMNKVNLFDIFV